MAESLEGVLRKALEALVAARDACPHAAEALHREIALQEIVRAELSVSRALQLIGAGG